jgi:hypothetical protein
MGLGLDVKDGCGGYYSSQQRVALDTLSPSIAQDRLRNGLLFCDIAMVGSFPAIVSNMALICYNSTRFWSQMLLLTQIFRN